ncbi:hypothetical protein DFR24_1526 [Panacagrimonas perspica]|uniref:Uncharacterized protein n=1 Tax=Panacagrimonas perspica TaxID=381431 RepID=A0A4S3JZU3_9GAMM|nr:hypothetical protein [Panacagrimonas perspica]TDU32138.1 hypothetical protein DFR24_1526 [Panacagrimonas perspica]THD01157.1 hypothetical protein B1810_21460 [Panacagrimonas perspica]
MNRGPRLTGILLATTLACFCLSAPVAQADEAAPSSQSLRQLYTDAAPALRASAFGRPMRIESTEARGSLRGEVLVEIDQPLDRLVATLERPASWCEVLLLTPNVVACAPVGDGDAKQLAVRLSRRFDQPAKEAYAATFDFRLTARQPDYVHLLLTAKKGPVGTRDYRFDVEALALDARRSVLRMVYSYSYGLTARLATQAYLSTKGSEKIGFSTEPGKDGKPRPVGGLRGSVERNAMRYALAIEAHSAQAPDRAASTRFDSSLDLWLTAIGRYAAQIGEDDVAAYRKEKQAQFKAAPSS